MINVTKTFFPPLDEYSAILESVWRSEWLTNRGALVQQLENNLKDFLSVKNILLTNNGTIPLQIALKLLGKGGEVITTPFSYVATTAAIVWENCTPVFVDIDAEHLTIDENKIQEAITSRTSAILATHVFGNPCNVAAIEKIAKMNNLKVIYDAAHCFGVKYEGKSLFDYGDISTCSFHATKIFHTGEGGAIFCSDNDLAHRIFYSHNFGHNGPLDFFGLGINAKISELQAAMGLAVFPYIETIFDERKKVVTFYQNNLDFNYLQTIKIRKGTEWNYSYYPVIFNTTTDLLRVQKELNTAQIFPRRYFYPSLNTIEYSKGNNKNMPVSESIASRVLCLPLFVGLTAQQLALICNVINSNNVNNRS